MKTYTLKGKNGLADIAFTIADLAPIRQQHLQPYDNLVKLINYTRYDTDWEQPMGEDYENLYSIIQNKQTDFFKIRDTQVVILPGTYVYPTLLNEQEVIQIGLKKMSVNIKN
jgi:hypothetical protein